MFPGIVAVGEGEIVRLPVVFVPDQNTLVPKRALVSVKVLFPAPPLTAFQTTWTLPTVIVS